MHPIPTGSGALKSGHPRRHGVDMTRERWTDADIPDVAGRVFIVTGANSGLGLATSHALAQHGGHVILAVRDRAKGERAAAGIAAVAPGARVEVRTLDLADLDAVRRFADALHADHDRLDVLVNNAGIMAPPRTLSPQGNEIQMAVNHLGHFALTGLLLDLLAAGSDARIVTVSSVNHRHARIRWDDLTGERGYGSMRYYNASKLANAIFGWELHRRLSASGSPVRSVLAHPGYSATKLQTQPTTRLWMVLLASVGNVVLGQRAERGAWPQLYAATEPGVAAGAFIGPGGPGELRGYPRPVRLAAAATDPENGRRLWEYSEEATGVKYL
jgi:NAD(P)-dependent dehydrogenase (short-subunit alcohol dehydrogenase family)